MADGTGAVPPAELTLCQEPSQAGGPGLYRGLPYWNAF